MTARSANPHTATDTPVSRRNTLSNVSKRSYLRSHCYVVRHTNKGNLSFKKGLAPRVDEPFFNKYLVPELETGGEEILFRPDWNVNVNDHTIDPRVCTEILNHIVFPWDVMFASQISSTKLMTYFSITLMQVSIYIYIYATCFCSCIFFLMVFDACLLTDDDF